MPQSKDLLQRITSLDIAGVAHTAYAVTSLGTVLAESKFKPSEQYRKKLGMIKMVPEPFRNYNDFLHEIDTHLESLNADTFKSETLSPEMELLGIVAGTLAFKALSPRLKIEFLSNLP